MAATVWDPQYAGMESGESFQRSGAADCEGICLGNEKFMNFAYWIEGEGYNSYPGRYGITGYAPTFEYIYNGNEPRIGKIRTVIGSLLTNRCLIRYAGRNHQI